MLTEVKLKTKMITLFSFFIFLLISTLLLNSVKADLDGEVGGSEDIDIIFLHHSTGNNVYFQGGVVNRFDDYNSDNGTNFNINERAYPNTPYPWDNYSYDWWNLWVTENEDSSPRTPACNNSQSGIECLSSLTQNYDVIIMKQCYPGASVLADTGSPNISSSRKSLENYKLQYRALRREFDKYPDNVFVVWTLTPLHRLSTNTGDAARAKEFVDWMKNDWLNEDGESHPNIKIFDFWGIVAETQETPLNGQYNTLKYDYEGSHSSGDSHPNNTANIVAGPLFGQNIVDSVNEYLTYKNSLVETPSRPTGQTAIPNGARSINFSWNYDDVVEVDYFKIYDETSGSAVYLTGTTNRTFTITGLEPNTSYTYSVSAVSEDGVEGPISGGAGTMTDVETPSRPTGQTAIPNGARSINFSWNYDDVVEVDYFNIYDETSGAAVYLTGTTNRTFTITGLEPNTSYTYSVSAVSEDGVEGPISGGAGTMTDVETPSRPTGQTAIPNGARSINFSWNYDDVVEVDYFKIYDETSGSAVYLTGTTNRTFTITGLEPNTSYTYSVSAVSEDGVEGPISGGAGTMTDVETPSRPTGQTAIPNGARSINFSWNYDDVVEVDYFKIYDETSGSAVYLTGTTNRTFTITGLEPNTSYTYSVSAVSEDGVEGPISGGAGTMTDVETPSRPTGQTAIPNGARSINFSWNYDDVVEVDYFKIYDETSGSAVYLTGTTNRTFTITGLEPNTSYTYSVSAVSEDGVEGPISGGAGTMTDVETLNIPENVLVVSIGTGTLLIDWEYDDDNTLEADHFNVYEVNGTTTLLGNTTDNFYYHENLQAGSTHSYKISAVNVDGDEGNLSSSASGTTDLEICTSFTYSSWGTCQSNNTQTRTVLTQLPNGCSGGSPVLSQSCVYDNQAPTRSNGLPTGNLTSGTSSTTLSVTTNENASCKYSTIANTSYTNMSGILTSSGLTHAKTLTGLTDGTSYNYYVRCIDGENNENTNDYTINFSISVPTCTSFTYSSWGTCQSNNTQTRTVLTQLPSGCSGGSPVLSQSCVYDNQAPTRSNGLPTGNLTSGTTSTTLSVTTNENASCKYSTIANTSYTNMSGILTSSGLTHTKTLTGLTDGTSYNYYVRCIDGENNENTNDYTINFSILVPTCTSFTYSSWGTCQSNNTQTRTVLTQLPSGCSGGSPVLSQSCTYSDGGSGGGSGGGGGMGTIGTPTNYKLPNVESKTPVIVKDKGLDLGNTNGIFNREVILFNKTDNLELKIPKGIKIIGEKENEKGDYNGILKKPELINNIKDLKIPEGAKKLFIFGIEGDKKYDNIEFTEKVEIKIPIKEKKIEVKEKISIYFYDEKNKKYEEIKKDDIKIEGGELKIEITKLGKYIILDNNGEEIELKSASEFRIDKFEEINKNKDKIKENLLNFNKEYSKINQIIIPSNKKEIVSKIEKEYLNQFDNLFKKIKEDTNIEEKKKLIEELKDKKDEYYEKIKENFGEQSLYLKYIEAKEGLSLSNLEIMINNQKIREEFRGQYSKDVEKYKGKFLGVIGKKIEIMVDKTPRKIENGIIQVDKLIKETELNTKITQTKKKTLMGKLISIKEILEEKMEEKQIKNDGKLNFIY